MMTLNWQQEILVIRIENVLSRNKLALWVCNFNFVFQSFIF